MYIPLRWNGTLQTGQLDTDFMDSLIHELQFPRERTKKNNQWEYSLIKGGKKRKRGGNKNSYLQNAWLHVSETVELKRPKL